MAMASLYFFHFGTWCTFLIPYTLERHFTEHFYESRRERGVEIVCYSILNKNLDLHPQG